MQAITTKYIPASNVKGSRIVAKCQAKRIVIPYDHEGAEHFRAAMKLAQIMGWSGRWYEGGLPDGTGFCYVCADERDSFTIVGSN